MDGVDWSFLFVSCFLIGSFSWFLIGWWTLDSAISLVKIPAIWLVGDLIVNSPNVRSSIRILCTITLCKDIQYIQSTCIHYAVFNHSWYDYVVYCYTLHVKKKTECQWQCCHYRHRWNADVKQVTLFWLVDGYWILSSHLLKILPFDWLDTFNPFLSTKFYM